MKSIALFILIICQTIGHGQVKTFTLLGSEWHNPNAWIPIGVPAANDSVIIQGICSILPDSTANAKYVFVEESFGQLDILRNIPNNKKGTLIIKDAPGNGLVVKGVFTNGGKLTIRRSTDTAIVNRGTIEILDSAKVVIDSTVAGPGIYNASSITSSGSIDIERARSGIVNEGTFVNEPNAEISIQNLFQFGTGIKNGSADTMVSQGHIEIIGIVNTGIENFGYFKNHDTIVLDEIKLAGIANYDTLINTSTGHLNISILDDFGIINITGSIVNERSLLCS